MKSKAIKISLLVLILLLAGGYFAVVRLRTGPALRSQALQMAGLAQPVEILYDSMGVPHLFAASMEDLFLAQGYVHATHRLWQMEMFRRVLQGRMSEIFGARTLDTDRFLRTIGMEKAARDGLPDRGSPAYRYAERYAEGVNAAIQGWKGPLPPEFVLLRLEPEQWDPVLAQGIEKIMAWDLSDYQTGLNLAAARELLGDSALAPLMPRYPSWGPTIVEGFAEGGRGEGAEVPAADTAVAGASTAAAPLPSPTPAELLAQAALSEETTRVLELGSTVQASNSWVVGGQRSRSGKPLVANDMHLALNAPNIWFLIGLHVPGMDAVGMSLPGAPGIVTGHTRAVAWAHTNAMLDDADFFIEKVNPDDPEQYLTPAGWAPFEQRQEIIRVRGAAPDTLTVRSTRHGPVVTPVEERAGDQVLAFQWVAHYPAGTFDALLGMTQAGSVEEFLTEMRTFDDPHQNVVFADTAGSWGYWMGGRVPLRASGTPPQLPVPGWTGEHDWVGWLPFEEKPHVLAPERGYIATANNMQTTEPLARLVSDGNWFGSSPYRAQRISDLLEASDQHDATSLLAIQMDVHSVLVDRYMDDAVAAFRSAGLGDLAARLEGWDRNETVESTEATLFYSWWTALRLGFRDRYYGGRQGYFPDRMVEHALDGALPLPQGVAEEAARTAVAHADMPWGEAHTLTLDHPLRSVPVLGRLFRFGRSGIPRPGSPNTVNVSYLTGSQPPFEVRSGPSQRHVVDMADPDGSGGFILPGGESGYPAHPHSFDQLELWREGRLWLLPLARDRVEARAVATVRLEPGGTP